MLIIINDDPAYVSWIARHRQGFVVDSKRKPTRNGVILHRAICSVIKPHKRARLTTGGHIKACSLDAAELECWAREQTGGGLTTCRECHSDEEEHVDADHHVLTRLGKDVLSYVLDLAVMYLDGEETHFHATVQDIAKYLDKTVAQITPAVHRLINEGYLEWNRTTDKTSLAANTITYPTAKAIRTIPAFAAMSEENVGTELGQLKRG